MKYTLHFCSECGGSNGHHEYGCPNAPDSKPIHTCAECGDELHYGDEVVQIGDRYYCGNCCDCYTLEDEEGLR